MLSVVVTDFEELRRLGEAKEGENLDFRRYLKAHPHPEGTFVQIARDVEARIDCTACGNCCRYTRVTVSAHDIETLAVYLKLAPSEVVRQYTVPDADAPGARILDQPADECVFLDGNLCMVYDARPQACREFPHLHSGHRSLGSRMASVCGRAWYCPIVYNVLEEYKQLVGYHH